MSGGRFDYAQYHISEIADAIESELKKQGKPKSEDDLWSNEECYEKYPEQKFYYTHPKEIQDEMRNAIRILRQAAVYAQRIDWYLSGDDGADSFLDRLKSELDALKI